MTATADAATAPRDRRPLWIKLAAALVLLVLALVLLVVFFPWDLLRGPLNRYVTEKTGRHFAITRKLDVKLGRTATVLADGIEFANPSWAQDPYLVRAEAAKIQVRLWPLLRRQLEFPLVVLSKPQLGLQWEADGRRSWAIGGKDTGDKRNLPVFGALVVDEGQAHFVAPHEGADIRTDFVIAQSQPSGTASTALPLSFKARGTWQREPFSAEGRTGNVLHLSAPLQNPFPAELKATSGRTTLAARGEVASLATLEGANAQFNLQGQNLADLYRLTGMVLPETPRYSVQGRLSKRDDVWHVQQIQGKLGQSDIGGELAFDRRQKVPHLTGALQSKSLDFDDLAPLVGLPEQPRSAAALPQVAGAAPVKTAARPSPTARSKVLPTATLDLERLKAMNADVKYSAARITNVRQLPLDKGSLRVRLQDGVLNLDPLNLGVAGGTFAGRLRIDGNRNPAMAEIHLDGKSLELNRLFPGVKIAQANFGKMWGNIDLKGPGNSVAQMLANSSGDVALMMGRGQISNLILEVAGLDGGEIIKFLLRGDQNVQMRCAATAFNVDKGLMTARAFVVDTNDTVIYGNGTISLADENIDLILRPYPKDPSILSLRSPLKVAGPFVKPKAGVDTGALGARAGIALALGAVNPLLALAATIETGPGTDADCGMVLRQASTPDALARVNGTVAAPEGGTAAMGAPGKPAAPAAPRGRPGADYPLEPVQRR